MSSFAENSFPSQTPALGGAPGACQGPLPSWLDLDTPGMLRLLYLLQLPHLTGGSLYSTSESRCIIRVGAVGPCSGLQRAKRLPHSTVQKAPGVTGKSPDSNRLGSGVVHTLPQVPLCRKQCPQGRKRPGWCRHSHRHSPDFLPPGIPQTTPRLGAWNSRDHSSRHLLGMSHECPSHSNRIPSCLAMVPTHHSH